MFKLHSTHDIEGPTDSDTRLGYRGGPGKDPEARDSRCRRVDNSARLGTVTAALRLRRQSVRVEPPQADTEPPASESESGTLAGLAPQARARHHRATVTIMILSLDSELRSLVIFIQ